MNKNSHGVVVPRASAAGAQCNGSESGRRGVARRWLAPDSLAAPRSQSCFHLLLQHHLAHLPQPRRNRWLPAPLSQRTLLAHFTWSPCRHRGSLRCPESPAERFRAPIFTGFPRK